MCHDHHNHHCNHHSCHNNHHNPHCNGQVTTSTAGGLHGGFTSLVTSWQGFIGLVWSVVFVFVLVDRLCLFCVSAIPNCCLFEDLFYAHISLLHRFEDPRPSDPLGVASPQLGIETIKKNQSQQSQSTRQIKVKFGFKVTENN